MTGIPNSREAFYADIKTRNLAPLWESLHSLITPTPKSRCEPAFWRYDDIREDVLRSGELITAKEAERRVLIMENPGMPGEARITTSLYAGLQLILPGEVAPAHRHTQSALRFVMEGEGAYTAVNGERTTMHEGDFIITPSWTWHDHGNDGDAPMVWLDGLDIPVLQFLDASFVEQWPNDSQPVTRPEGDSLARYGQGLLPVDHDQRGHTSPVFNYPFARTREALATLGRTEDWDSCHGTKLRYVNPETGDHAMNTIAAFMQLLPKGFSGETYRSTDATVFCAAEGTGESIIGDQVFTWGPRDTFVAPSWAPVSHKSLGGDAVLFSFSDRSMQQKLGLWREKRGP